MRTTATSRADVLCANTARAQFGLISRTQARAAGLTDRAISRRVTAKQWMPVLPGVWAVNGTPPSKEMKAMAATLYAGTGSAVSHTTAAWILGLDGYQPRPIHVSTNRPLRPGRVPIKLHRVDLPWDQVVIVSGIPTTSAARTIVDLAGSGHRRVAMSLDEALRRQLTTLAELWSLHDDPSMRGRRGVGRLKSLLIERTPQIASTDSDLEVLALRLLRTAGLPAPQCQYPVELPSGRIRIDLAYPEQKLGIELDGYTWHHGKEAFDNDRRRDLELGLRGWRILRFTKPLLQSRPAFFTSTVAAHLAQR